MRVIHIGHTKTGTTYMQSNVLGPLSFAGLLLNYVGNNGRDSTHKREPLNHAFVSIGAGTTTDYQAGVIQEFMSSNEDYFISVEAILGRCRDQNLSEFADRLSRHVPEDSEIVISVRALDSIFDSTFQQAVKGDFLEGPDEFFFNVGPRRRHQYRRERVLELTKYDLDALVSALLEKFQTVVLLDIKTEGYLKWLAQHAGTTVEEIRRMTAARKDSPKSLNSSLSSSSVKILQTFNFLARCLFMTFRITQLQRLDKEAINSLRPTEALRYKLLYTVIGIKSKLVGFLRVVDSKRPTRGYTLPEGLREEILSRIPDSKLFNLVMENGGFLRIERNSVAFSERL